MNQKPPHIPETLVETESVKIIRDAARTALEFRWPVHVVGRPGTGKSSALWHVARDMGGVYCEVTALNKTVNGMFDLLLDSAGLWDKRLNARERAAEVYRAFRPHEFWSEKACNWATAPKFLVVDEVQTLEATAMRELLRLQKTSELALLLAGNAERLAGQKKDSETLEQTERRIKMRRTLPGPSKQDCELIGSAFNVEGAESYAFVAAFGMQTNFGDLTALLEIAKRLTGGSVGIRHTHFEDALRITAKNTHFLKLLKAEAA